MLVEIELEVFIHGGGGSQFGALFKMSVAEAILGCVLFSGSFCYNYKTRGRGDVSNKVLGDNKFTETLTYAIIS